MKKYYHYHAYNGFFIAKHYRYEVFVLRKYIKKLQILIEKYERGG